MSRMTDEELLVLAYQHGIVQGLRDIESEARRRAFLDVESSCCHAKLDVEEFSGRIVWVCGACKVACISQRKAKES